MSSESDAISVAHMCLHLPHVQVITERLLTTNTQPSWWHFGHLIGRGQLVFGDTGGTGSNYGSARSVGQRILRRWSAARRSGLGGVLGTSNVLPQS